MRPALALPVLLAALAAAPPATPDRTAETTAPSEPRFVDVTDASGVRFVHNTGAFGQKWLPETMGSGVVVFDADGDGRLDLLLVNGRSFPGKPGEATTQKLFLNKGGFRFEDATARFGLDLSAYCFGGAAADLDNDGDPDLYLSCLGRDYLLRHDGNGFKDVSAAAGIAQGSEFGASVILFDADRDGLLDIYATRYVQWSAETDAFCSVDGKAKTYCTPVTYPAAPSRFYKNLGNFTFEDRTRQVGLYQATAKSLGVAMLDLEGDGWPDLAVANDTTLLFHNKGQGQFEEIGLAAGVALSESGTARGGMGIDAADYDRSGRPSIVVTNFANEMTGLYHGEGERFFRDLAPASVIGRGTREKVGWGSFFFDYDLDGWLDLFQANGHLDREWEKKQLVVTYAEPQQLFHNEGGGRFVEVTGTAGGDLAAPMVARGAAFGDLDGDGDLDIVVTANGGPAKLFENRGGGHGHWLRLALEGTRSNWDGIGGQVEVTVGGATQTWLVHTGGTYLSQSQVEPTFGLGAAQAVDKVVIRWPSKVVQTLTGIKADQRLKVTEPK